MADQTIGREWCSPERDWIPIVRAVLQLADRPGAREPRRTEEGPFSFEAFASFGKATAGAGLIEGRAHTSTAELTRILREKAQAQEVEIDVEAGAFKFVFAMLEGGASVYAVSPCAILDALDAAPAVEPRVLAESLFNTEGLVRLSDESAIRHAEQHQRVREAVGLIWRQYLLRDFDGEVAEERLRLYGRVGSALSPFRQLPSELWARLDVLQWQHGIARDFEGTIYYAIHVARGLRAPPNGKTSIRSETAAIGALAKELTRSPDISREEARLWCQENEYRITARGFLQRVWPGAREAAGLPPLAPAGRKKSKR